GGGDWIRIAQRRDRFSNFDALSERAYESTGALRSWVHHNSCALSGRRVGCHGEGQEQDRQTRNRAATDGNGVGTRQGMAAETNRTLTIRSEEQEHGKAT